MSKFTEGSWQRAFTAVKEQFELESLLPEQENALREFLEGRNVFQSLQMLCLINLGAPVLWS